MFVYEFNLKQPLQYILAGKTADPTQNYLHAPLVLENYELIIITEGTLYISYSNMNYVVNAGEFLFLPPLPEPQNMRKGYRTSKCAFYWLHFIPGEMAAKKHIYDKFFFDYCSGLKSEYFCIPEQGKLPNLERMIILMKQLQDAVKSSYSSQMLDYITTVISLELFNQLNINTHLYGNSRKTQTQIYQDMLTYIKLNIEGNLKVSDIAKHFGYNSKYISKLFLALSGTSLKQYILSYKIDLANYMLTDTSKNITEIAAALGFSDGHNFARTYKKMTGLTPTEYRNAFSKRILVYR